MEPARQTINFTVAANAGPLAHCQHHYRRPDLRRDAGRGRGRVQLFAESDQPQRDGGGRPSSVEVKTAAGCSWTSSGVPAWITGVPANGTGTTTINFTVAANPDPAPRTANITIGGQTFTVTQDAAAAACSYSLNPTSHNPTAAGGPSSVEVTTTAGCSWTSSGVPAWITRGTGQWNGDDDHQFHRHRQPRPRSAHCQHHYRRPNLHRDAGRGRGRVQSIR